MFRQMITTGLALLLLQGAAYAGKSMELRSANTYYNQGEKAQALTWYEKAAAKGTGEAQVYQRLVELYAEKKEWAKMRDAFAQIDGCKDKPKKLEGFKEEAQSTIDEQWMGLWNGSIRQFELADSLVAAGDSAGAADAFEKSRERIRVALNILPDRSDLQKRLGDIYISEFNSLYLDESGFPVLAGAIEPYATLVEQNPDSLDYAMTLIQLCFNVRDFDKARAFADQSLLRFPDNADLLSYAGKARIQQGLALGDAGKPLLAEASDFILKAIERNPGDPKMLYNLALLYRDMGKQQKAIETFVSVIDAAGDNPGQYAFDSAYSLAVLYIQDLPEDMQDANKAAQYFEYCLNMQPENQALKTNLGVALMRTGDKAKIERGKQLLGY